MNGTKPRASGKDRFSWRDMTLAPTRAVRPTSCPSFKSCSAFAAPGHWLWQIESGPQPSHSSPVQHRMCGGCQQIGMWDKAVDAFVERNGAAAWHTTFRLIFWAGVEIA